MGVEPTTLEALNKNSGEIVGNVEDIIDILGARKCSKRKHQYLMAKVVVHRMTESTRFYLHTGKQVYT